LFIANVTYAGKSHWSSGNFTAKNSVNDTPILEVVGTNGVSYLKINNDGNILGMVVNEQDVFLDPATSDSYTYLNIQVIDDCGAGTSTMDSPVYPRTVNFCLYTYANANTEILYTTCEIGISGTDVRGNVISESVSIAGLVANSITSVVSTKAYLTIAKVYTGTGLRSVAGSADTFTCGQGASFQLKGEVYNDTLTFGYEAGSGFKGTYIPFNTIYDLVTPVTAPNGSRDYIYTYRSRVRGYAE